MSTLRMRHAYDELAAQIRRRILAGELRDGDRLPSEVGLAEEAGVSRTTVREALRTLEEAGFVERQSPKVVVAHRPSGEAFSRGVLRSIQRLDVSYNDMFEFLLLVEPEMARLAAARRDSRSVDRLKRNLDAEEAAPDHPSWVRLDTEFHHQVALMSRNPVFVTLRTPMWEIMFPIFSRLSDRGHTAARAIRFHRRIVEEIERGDSEAAALVMNRHVKDSREVWDELGFDVMRPIEDLIAADAGAGGERPAPM